MRCMMATSRRSWKQTKQSLLGPSETVTTKFSAKQASNFVFAISKKTGKTKLFTASIAKFK